MLLTLLMYIKLAITKKKEISTGNVDLKKTALDASAWPESVIKINNNLRNQFETPILFYLLCLLLWALRGVDTVSMMIACLYTAARYVHAAVHTSSNNVPQRFMMFLFSMGMLLVLFGLTVKTLATL